MHNDIRRTDPQKDLYSWDRQIRGQGCMRTLEFTAPAANTSIAVVYRTSGTFVAQLTGEDPAPEIMCSGILHQVGNGRVGVTQYDSRLGELASMVIDGEALLIVDNSISWADGDQAYMIPWNTATTGGTITNVDGGGTNIPVGQFVGASTDADSRFVVASKAPLRLPDATYGRVWIFPIFNQ